jgi:ABC-2 type transport system permease protein
MWEVFKFECRYQARSPLFWSVAGVFFLLALFAMASDSISVGGPSDNLKINASFVILQTQLTFSILGLFAGIAFVAGAITRDYEAKTAELFFSSGISPAAYLLGRFWGGYLFAALVLVTALLGTLVGELLPVHDVERLAPFTLAPYLFSLIVFVLPNALIFCSLFYVVAALTRSMLAAYLAALAFLVLYITLQTIADAETLTQWAIAEPFGSIAIDDLSRYWTVSERNFSVPSFAGVILSNRLVWVGISLLMLFITTWRYRFELTPWR